MTRRLRRILRESNATHQPMILGTGIDIVEVARIAASYEKFGERFINRILRPSEIA